MSENKEATLPHSAPRVRVLAASSCAAAVPTRPAAVCAEAAAAEPRIRGLWLSVGAVALGAFACQSRREERILFGQIRTVELRNSARFVQIVRFHRAQLTR